ncbi:DDT domain-containing protein [Trifolium medium]|uniref:DDT domain-containing protein n=1 Tax=Trifolium medium TaxID=97028 RepID=A0A392M564_9FABA|nr:DDT domain-containing protein [Trifolium medium]
MGGYLLKAVSPRSGDTTVARKSSELQKRSKDLMQNIANDESALRRSTRVRAPPRENPANAFLKYVNKWKEE